MSVRTDRKFDIPAKTISEAIRALRKAGAPEATVFA